MSFQSKLLLLVGLILIYYLNPLYIRSSAFSLAKSVHGFVDLTPQEDPHSLKAAVANVTTDIHQLTSILDDFFQRQPDNSVEESLKEFLKRKAVRKHRDLEYYLDWILGFYKFAWPFVLVYALMKISSAKTADERSKQKRRKKIEGETKSKNPNAFADDKSSLNAVLRDDKPGGKSQFQISRRIGSASSLG